MASYTTDTPRHVVEDYLQKNGGVSTHHISETQRSSRLNQVRETGEPENASYRNHDGNGYHHGDANMSNRSNNRLHQTYPSNDGDYSQRQRGLSLEYGKTIKLLRNGDEFFNGQKVVINSRKYRYFDVFLDDVSSSINARFGAVRSIHTPIHGHRIKSLDQIEDGKTYVANGGGRFVKLNYMDISEGKRVSPARLPNIVTGPAADFSTPLYDKVQNVIIYVYRNGDVITPPARVLLHKNTLQSYDAVFNEISNKVTLTNGPILKLFTLEGESIITPTQLTTGSCYVAASKDRFKRCEYYPPNDFSPRLNRKSNSQPASITSSNASTSGKSNQSYPGKPYTGWHKEAPNRNYSLPPINDPKQRRRLNIEKDENSTIYNSRPVANKNEENLNNNQPQHKPQLAKANSKQQPQSPNAKKEPTVDEAASKIQASFRGHDARETQRESERAIQPEHHNISEEEAATKIQSVYRGYTVRTKGELAKQKSRASLAKEQSVDMTVDEAATVVQSHYRGEVDRQSSVEQRQPEPRHEEMTVDEAAVKIQSQFRGHEARTESPKQNEQTVDEAATVIQSHFRGVNERQEEEKPATKQNEEMSVDEAATKIQSSFRGHEERRDSKQSEQEMSIDQAATEVQSSFRGHVAREEAKETKEDDSHQLSTDEAAIKIQSAYRSYKTRQETRDNIHQENQLTAADPSSGLI